MGKKSKRKRIWMRERNWHMQRPCDRRKHGSFKGWREGPNGLIGRLGGRSYVKARG